MSRVVILLIEDEDYAWDVFEAASENADGRSIVRAAMVNPDHPQSIADIVREAR